MTSRENVETVIRQIKDDHPNGGYGTIVCPECGGKLSYFMERNGMNSRGSCRTRGCIKWLNDAK